MNLIVIAKAPEPGRVKTRLCPPCTEEEAAALAEAALRDTMRVVSAVPGVQPVIALDGDAPSWIEVPVIPQRGSGLDERIAAAFADVGAPGLLIGMDTPQVTTELLTHAIALLRHSDAVLGEAVDGGWWAAGVRRIASDAFRGVPMSTSVTGRAQRARLQALGYTVADLPTLRDVDTFEDARLVADEIPDSAFATCVGAIARRTEAASA